MKILISKLAHLLAIAALLAPNFARAAEEKEKEVVVHTTGTLTAHQSLSEWWNKANGLYLSHAVKADILEQILQTGQEEIPLGSKEKVQRWVGAEAKKHTIRAYLRLSEVLNHCELFDATYHTLVEEIFRAITKEREALVRLAETALNEPQNLHRFQMCGSYEGENFPVWAVNRYQGFSTQVRYLTPPECGETEVTLENGKIMKDGQPFSSSSLGAWREVIFVVSPEMKIYTACHSEGEFHHSSFLRGYPVQTAGHWKVINGDLVEINNRSGHYCPSALSLQVFLHYLQAKGFNIDATKVYYTRFEHRYASAEKNILLSAMVQVSKINSELIAQAIEKFDEKWDLDCPHQRGFLKKLIVDGDDETLRRVLPAHSIAGDGLFDPEISLEKVSSSQRYEEVKMNLIHFATEKSARPEVFIALQHAGVDINQADTYGRLALGMVVQNAAPADLAHQVDFFLALGANATLLHGKGQKTMPLLLLMRISAQFSAQDAATLRHTVYGQLQRAGASLRENELMTYDLVDHFPLFAEQVCAYSDDLVICYLKRAIRDGKVAVVRSLLASSTTIDVHKKYFGISLFDYAKILDVYDATRSEIFKMICRYQHQEVQ